MSAGSKVVPVRIPDALLGEIQVALDGRNERTRGEQMTLSEFIRAALAEKLAKMQRSRTRRAKIAQVVTELLPSLREGV